MSKELSFRFVDCFYCVVLKRRSFGLFLTLFLFACSFLFSINYEISDLKIKNANIYTIEKINQEGYAIGVCRFDPSQSSRVGQLYIYMWDPDNGLAFQVLNRPSPSPIFINNSNEISENAINDNGDMYRVHEHKLYKNNQVIESTLKWLPYFDGPMQNPKRTTSIKVNNTGMVLGTVETSSERIDLVIYDESSNSMTVISRNTKYLLSPSSINDNGVVVGEVVGQLGRQTNRGFLWSSDLGLQYLNFIPKAINNDGLIVGTNGYESGVVWRKGKIINISDEIELDSNFSTELISIDVLHDINDQGQMIGEGRTQDNRIQFVRISPRD